MLLLVLVVVGFLVLVSRRAGAIAESGIVEAAATDFEFPGPAGRVAHLESTGAGAVTQSGTGLLEQLLEALAGTEGFAPGTRAYRNNNPGNLKFEASLNRPGYIEDRAIGADSGGFAIFATMEDGWNALKRSLESMVRSHPDFTLTNAMAHYLGNADPYNPQVTAEGDPFAKANTIAQALGVPPNTKISTLVGS